MFLDDTPGYVASLRRLLKALLSTGGGIIPPPRWIDYLNAVYTHVSGVHRTTIQC